MESLVSYAALCLAAGALLSLLPDGSLRRTASAVMGLMMALSWFGMLQDVLHLPDWPERSAGVLTAPSASLLDDLTAAREIYARQSQEAPP